MILKLKKELERGWCRCERNEPPPKRLVAEGRLTGCCELGGATIGESGAGRRGGYKVKTCNYK